MQARPPPRHRGSRPTREVVCLDIEPRLYTFEVHHPTAIRAVFGAIVKWDHATMAWLNLGFKSPWLHSTRSARSWRAGLPRTKAFAKGSDFHPRTSSESNAPSKRPGLSLSKSAHRTGHTSWHLLQQKACLEVDGRRGAGGGLARRARPVPRTVRFRRSVLVGRGESEKLAGRIDKPTMIRIIFPPLLIYGSHGTVGEKPIGTLCSLTSE